MNKLKLQKGITLSGGEPFLQPKPLIEIAKEAKHIGLDVWSYSGFKIEELLNTNHPLFKDRLNLLKYIDVLVDGKFEEDKKNIALKFRGSDNQRVIDVPKTIKEFEDSLELGFENYEVILKEEYMDLFELNIIKY